MNQKTHHTFARFLYDIHEALQNSESNERTIAETVPPEYHKYLSLFRKVNADQVSPHRPYDYRIDLQEGFEPTFGPLVSLC